MKKSNNKSISTHKKFKLKDLISNDKNSIQYFNNLRWKEKKKCPRCGCYILYNISPNRYGCKKCRYKFSNFTGTYLGKLRIKPSLITHLLHLFVSKQSAYIINKHLKCHRSTVERTFKVFRQAIYDNSLQHIHQELKSYREIGLNERILNVSRQKNHYLEFKHNIDGKECLIFAIYDMRRVVVAFPVSNIEPTILGELIQRLKVNKEITPMYEHGSFYKKNDYIAYGMLDIENDKVVAYNDVYGGTEGIYLSVDGFWDFVEKWLYHYRGVPKQYFHLYLKEIEFRFNNRNKDMFYKLSKLLVKPLPLVDNI